jgi:epoxyqueuosine reductase
MDEADWIEQLRGTALKRAKRVGLVRNAILILGTRRVARALEPIRAYRDDPDPTLAWAARWALARLEAENTAGPAPL